MCVCVCVCICVGLNVCICNGMQVINHHVNADFSTNSHTDRYIKYVSQKHFITTYTHTHMPRCTNNNTHILTLNNHMRGGSLSYTHTHKTSACMHGEGLSEWSNNNNDNNSDNMLHYTLLLCDFCLHSLLNQTFPISPSCRASTSAPSELTLTLGIPRFLASNCTCDKGLPAPRVIMPSIGGRSDTVSGSR